MVTVPDFLKGATILDAHQWVVSNLDGRNEYVLKDMSGMETTLSDLTRGTVTEVNITPAGSRTNPAPSYVFKPEFQPQKRVQQFSSRVMLPDGISPSVVHALEAKHGAAYRFIASKMLSQRSRRQQLSPRGTRMLSSFIMADPYAGVRINPIGLRQTPSGIRMARIIGDRGRVMDDAIVAEVRRYLEGNELPFDIAASKKQFDMFTKGVLQPYLISLRSNQALIKYLNETLLPHMLRLIDAGEFDADVTEIGFFRKAFKSAVEAKTALKSAAGKDKVKKLLSDQYETVVRRLATSPQDFYYGRNEALVAHPAFLFPHAAAFLIPPPRRLTGGTRAEVFFYQAGEPPRYTTVDGKITQELPKRMLDKMPLARKKGFYTEGEAKEYYNLPIARVNNAPIEYGDVMNVENLQTALSTGNVGQVILMASQAFANDGVLKRMFGLGAATPPSGLTEEEGNALLDLNKIVQDMQNSGPIQLFKTFSGEDPEEFPLAAAIEVNIGGIRPKPLGWPEGLIFAVMQVISENADDIMRTEGHGPGDYFRPNLEGLGPQTIRLKAPADIDSKLSGFRPTVQTAIKNYYSKEMTLSDLSRQNDDDAYLNPAYYASIALHFATNSGGNVLSNDMIPDGKEQRENAKKKFKNNTAKDPRTQYKAGDARLQKFNTIAGDRQGKPEKLGLMTILQLAITRYKQDGGQPTPEQVTFVAQLTLYALSNLSTQFEAMDVKTIGDYLKDAIEKFEADNKADREEQFTSLVSKLDEQRAKIPEENALQQMVEDRLLEDFLTDLINNKSLEDVFENPRRNPPLPKLAEMIGNTKDINALKRARDTIRQKRKAQRSGLAGSPFTPDEKTVQRLADSLRGVFKQALAEVKQEREEAAEAIKKDEEMTALLGEFKDAEVSRVRKESYESLLKEIGKSLRALVVQETQFLEGFMAIPDDPTMELEDNLVRQEMFNHPLYIAQNLYGAHKMFMDNIRMVEVSLRAGLASARYRYMTTDEDNTTSINATQRRIEYFISSIEFCNGLQEAYADVGSSLGAAVDDMRVDDKDSISPHLYIALFDATDNFKLRHDIRQALSAVETTSLRMFKPERTKPVFDKLMMKSFDLISEMFGGFPGHIDYVTSGQDPEVATKLGITYLNRLVDEDLDFYGSEDNDRRFRLISEVTGAKNLEAEALAYEVEQGDKAFEARLAEEDDLAKFIAKQTALEMSTLEEDLADAELDIADEKKIAARKLVELAQIKDDQRAITQGALLMSARERLDLDDELTDAKKQLERKVEEIAQLKAQQAEERETAVLRPIVKTKEPVKENPNEHPFDTRYDMTHQDSNVDTTQGTSALSDEALARGYYVQQKKRMPKKSVKMVNCMRCGKPTFEDSLVENSFCQKCADALARTNPVVRWSV